MKDFIVLFKGGLMDDTPPEVMEKNMVDWRKWMDELSKSGKMTGGNRLKTDGRVLSSSNGKITDKPYSETKEVVGGYISIKAEDYSEAVEIAKGCPIFKFNGTCEVGEIRR